MQENVVFNIDDIQVKRGAFFLRCQLRREPESLLVDDQPDVDRVEGVQSVQQVAAGEQAHTSTENQGLQVIC